MATQWIKIRPEVPVDLTLRYSEGKLLANGRMVFSSTDGRGVCVSEPDGRLIEQRLRDLRVAPGDRILLRQSCSYEGGVKSMAWEVFRAQVACGEQRDGTFIVPSQPGAAAIPAASQERPATTPARNDVLTDHHHNEPARSKDSPYEHCGMSQELRQQANMLCDVMASTVAYCERYKLLTHEDAVQAVLAAYRRRL